MERICTNCRAVMGLESEGDWCPACGGALMSRTNLLEGNQTDPTNRAAAPAAEVDHRGIVLPRRHALGGIITPQ